MMDPRFLASARKLAGLDAASLTAAVVEEALGLLDGQTAELRLDQPPAHGAVTVSPDAEGWTVTVPLPGFEAVGSLVARVAAEPAVELWDGLADWGRLVAMAIDYRRLQAELQAQGEELGRRREAESQKLDAALNLYDLYEEAINQAFTDGLTGLSNKVFFFQRLDQEFAEASRYGQPLSLLMLDVDYFKHVNDAYGHQAGDMVLKRLGELIRENIRASDLGARFGGEEFAIILPNTEEEGAFILAERIRKRLEAEVFETALITFRVTTSVGVSTLGPRLQAPQDFIEDADRGLYQAKRSGRNRVCHNREENLTVQAAQQVFANKQGAALEIAHAMALTLELKSPALAAHSRAVASYARQLGAALGLPPDRCDTLFLAGLLHDIGKLGLPGELLEKPVLTPEERNVFGLHPTLAINMLNRLSGFKAVRDAVQHHHEQVDGRGYPEGLAGDEIPLTARVLAVCNAFDGMVRGGPGRPAMAPELAREALRRGAGTLFDPDITQQFLELDLPLLELQPQYS